MNILTLHSGVYGSQEDWQYDDTVKNAKQCGNCDGFHEYHCQVGLL